MEHDNIHIWYILACSIDEIIQTLDCIHIIILYNYTTYNDIVLVSLILI